MRTAEDVIIVNTYGNPINPATEETLQNVLTAVQAIGGGGDGAILDGVSSAIKATVHDYANSNPLAVVLRDTNGDYVSVGGGTQYADGAVRGTATGTIAMGDDGTNIQSIHCDSSGDLQIDVLTMPTVAVTGTFWQATQPVSGAFYQATQPISAASLPLPTDAATQTTLALIKAKTDNIPALGQALAAASVPIVLTAAQETALTPPAAITGFSTSAKQDTLLTELQLKADLTETQPVSLASVPSHAVTNAGTFAVQAAEADGANVTLGAKADAKSTATDSTAITVMQVLKQISASVQAPPSQAVTFTGSTDVATQTTLASALTSLQLIDNAISGAGFNITQINGEAIDVGAGTEAAAIRVTLPTDGTGVVKLGAGVAEIGNVKNSGTFATQATLQTGSAAIGKLLPPDVDVTTHTNYARKYYTSAGAATDGIIWSPAAGKRWHVAWLSINVSAAATVTLEDDKAAGDDPVWKAELAANSGVFLVFPDQYPMSSGEDAADLLITTSAGNVYVSCGGWEI